MEVEKIVRYVDLSESQSTQIQIGVTERDGATVRIITPEWMAIARFPHPIREEQFVLYFLLKSGMVLDFLQRDTLEEAMDGMGRVVRRADWRECSIELPGPVEGAPRIPRCLVP
jgi:hypothetical protein